ncbi:MAG: sulfite exporter TauE/SafE family protein [Sphingomicrobium sp.]
MQFVIDSLPALLPFILAGFVAQLIDGALGMAFGTISSALMISLGQPPALASAGVHLAETFTTAASGISHIAHRNVDWRLFGRIAIPGIVGGIMGAYVLTQIDGAVMKPIVLTYLALIGLFLIYRSMKKELHDAALRLVAPLGFAGGFLDAAGGGGWGAIVTGNLLAQGGEPRRVIGTVNTAEFLVTATISATFIASMGWKAFTVATVGLLVGGVLAAPLGAHIVKRVEAKKLLFAVGLLLMLTSAYGIWRALA